MENLKIGLLQGLKITLKWLSGKKSVIGGIIMTTSAYYAKIEWIMPDTAIYINAMTTLIFGSASYATGKLIYKK